MALNWEEAPIDATHGVFGVALAGSPWRKADIENGKVYTWVAKVKGELEGTWVDRQVIDVDNYLEINKNFLEERPAPVEAQLPDGKVWPATARYYNPIYGGLFFDQHIHFWEGLWREWDNHTFEFWKALPDTIARFQGANPVMAPKKEEPPKRRQIGWWQEA